jgi:hypothetical protein
MSLPGTVPGFPIKMRSAFDPGLKDDLLFRRTGRSDDFACAIQLGKLNGERADATGSRFDQHALT